MLANGFQTPCLPRSRFCRYSFRQTQKDSGILSKTFRSAVVHVNEQSAFRTRDFLPILSVDFLARTYWPRVANLLDVLERKPGALAGSTALAQWRQAGRWPESFDRLWHGLNTRHGRQQGTRQMIDLLQLGAGDGWGRLRAAVEQALSLGCQDVAAIRHLMIAEQFDRPAVAPIDIGHLARYERPLPVMSGYDQLLSHAELTEVPA